MQIPRNILILTSIFLKMTIYVNGKPFQTKDNVTLIEVLHQFEITENTEGVAVAIDELVIFKTQWKETILKEGQKIEIVWARQGG